MRTEGKGGWALAEFHHPRLTMLTAIWMSVAMPFRFRAMFERRFPGFFLKAQGEKGVRRYGHRDYVGGRWDELGQLQLDMLRSKGLKPHHYLLDIACGSLRLGVKAIPYLEPEHYGGVEKEQALVEAGIREELGEELLQQRRPEFLITAAFEFERLSFMPDYAIAQSLFSHLPADQIALCLAKLRPRMKPGSVLFATFFEALEPVRNPGRAHDHAYFAYSRDEMLAFGDHQGFRASYLGDWGHPRGQVLVEYRPA